MTDSPWNHSRHCDTGGAATSRAAVRWHCFLLGAFFALLLTSSASLASPPVVLEPFASGLSNPVVVAHAGDGSGRLFIALQGGRIMLHDGNGVLPTPFLDISGLVSPGTERGLLGLAFHPDYAANGLFFVDYTDGAGDTVVARYRVSTDANVADPNSALILLGIDQPFSNHNGGQLAFGPAGYLYIAMGDGGSGGDPFNSGQSLTTLLGKILRIDVDGAEPYAIPPGNPFADDPEALDEIWAYGLRNPWRFSFDRLTGDLWVADVGQNLWEEINLAKRGSAGGENYGWRLMEGRHCFDPPVGCDPGGLTMPVLEYDHDDGCSVTGGYRYRGAAMPDRQGTYFYADYCAGTIWGATPGAQDSWTSSVLLSSGLRISTFGEDEAGEIYLGDRAGDQILKLVPALTCEIELDEAVYQNGDTVTATTFRYANRSSQPVTLEWKVWLRNASQVDLGLLNLGSDGQLTLPAQSDVSLPPTPLFTVNAFWKRGDYAFDCRMLDPTTGETLVHDPNPFRVE